MTDTIFWVIFNSLESCSLFKRIENVERFLEVLLWILCPLVCKNRQVRLFTDQFCITTMFIYKFKYCRKDKAAESNDSSDRLTAFDPDIQTHTAPLWETSNKYSAIVPFIIVSHFLINKCNYSLSALFNVGVVSNQVPLNINAHNVVPWSHYLVVINPYLPFGCIRHYYFNWRTFCWKYRTRMRLE